MLFIEQLRAKYFRVEINQDSLPAGTEGKRTTKGQQRDENDSAKFLLVTRDQSSTIYPALIRVDNYDGNVLEFIDPHRLTKQAS